MNQVPEKIELPDQLTFIIYQKLAQELTHLEEDLTPRLAARLIREAVDLLPGYLVRGGPDYERLRMKKMDEPSREVEVSIRDAIDSLMVIWNDYHKLQDLS